MQRFIVIFPGPTPPPPKSNKWYETFGLRLITFWHLVFCNTCDINLTGPALSFQPMLLSGDNLSLSYICPLKYSQQVAFR